MTAGAFRAELHLGYARCWIATTTPYLHLRLRYPHEYKGSYLIGGLSEGKSVTL
jgi:hypothetical protein